ncbi:MAG: hypothetical protein RIS69_1263 [Actinomycetota bacterium]
MWHNNEMSAHDLVIRNASLVDGTGAPARMADVAVSDGVITEVGPRLVGTGSREIDADGLTVTPGFVDIHTHFDGQATWDPILAPSSIHGVTSVVMGNCGVGFAPARPTPDQHAWLIGMLEGVEDIPGTALAEGLAWDWETFPDYMNALDRREYAIDVATQVAHAPLRAYVMGERGADPLEAPTVDELARMALMVREGMHMSIALRQVHHSALVFHQPMNSWLYVQQWPKPAAELYSSSLTHIFPTTPILLMKK